MVLSVERSELSNNSRFYTGSVIVTPSLAQYWLAARTYEFQRKTRSTNVDLLVDALRRGEFFGGMVIFGVLGDRRYLVDGQHRLTAIATSGISAEMVVTEYVVSSWQELADLYGRLDRHGVRTFPEVFSAHQLPDLTGLSGNQVRLLSGCAPVVLSGFSTRSGNTVASRSSDRRKDFVLAYASAAKAFFAAIHPAAKADHKRLSVAPVMSVALLTFHHAADIAEPFWSRVGANDGLRRGEPESALLTFIRTYSVTSSGAGRVSRGVASCWNAYVEGRDLQYPKVMNPAAPIIIKGTPFDGRVSVGSDD